MAEQKTDNTFSAEKSQIPNSLINITDTENIKKVFTAMMKIERDNGDYSFLVTPDAIMNMCGFSQTGFDITNIFASDPVASVIPITFLNQVPGNIQSHVQLQYDWENDVWPITWFRHTTSKEELLRTSFLTDQTTQNPGNYSTHSYMQTLASLIPIFQNKVLEGNQLTRTTYHLQSLFRSCLATLLEYQALAIPVVNVEEIGLARLADEMLTHPAYLDTRYPILLRNQIPTIGTDIQYFEGFDIEHDGKTILIVYCGDRYVHLGHAVVPGAAPAADCSIEFLAEVLATMDPESRKMACLLGQTVATFNDTVNVNHVKKILHPMVPRYNFWYHILDFATNRYDAGQTNYLISFPLQWIRKALGFVKNALARRFCELANVAWIMENRAGMNEVNIVTLLHGEHINSSNEMLHYGLYYHTPFELWPSITGTTLLISQMPYHPDDIMLSNHSPIQYMKRSYTDGRLDYPPAWVSSNSNFTRNAVQRTVVPSDGVWAVAGIWTNAGHYIYVTMDHFWYNGLGTRTFGITQHDWKVINGAVGVNPNAILHASKGIPFIGSLYAEDELDFT